MGIPADKKAFDQAYSGNCLDKCAELSSSLAIVFKTTWCTCMREDFQVPDCYPLCSTDQCCGSTGVDAVTYQRLPPISLSNATISQGSSWDYVGNPCVPGVPVPGCHFCAGVPRPNSASGCTQKNGADLHGGSQADCQNIADGNYVDCSKFGSHVDECKAVVNACANNTCNTYSIFFHPSCHTDPLGKDPAYNFCNFYQCSSKSQLASNLDGNCEKPGGCTAAWMTYTTLDAGGLTIV